MNPSFFKIKSHTNSSALVIINSSDSQHISHLTDDVTCVSGDLDVDSHQKLGNNKENAKQNF